VQNILHIVDAAGGLGAYPAGGTECAVGEILAGMGVMGELDALSGAHVVHGMHADHVAAAQGLDADLVVLDEEFNVRKTIIGGKTKYGA
jgi:hypothetical protein